MTSLFDGRWLHLPSFPCPRYKKRMRLGIVTLFPEFFETPLSVGVVGRGVREGLVGVETANPRGFAADKHKTVDDYAFGGGAAWS
ncbi:MAG: hypothetical protein M5R36_17900 [Deltaproteobacteria bacterium]|nr:hypothetical protein [Deltaproteobacteria bacterium]